MATDLNGLEKEKLIYIPVGNYAKYCLFKEDDKVLNIINNFSCSKDGLIPQQWFGNIDNPLLYEIL